ncbi:MAG TPA: T9SS type A sorting domain-containing protein, partial [Saprospiraceae bacterium]|nr:T9SS type A sorting domain-containing protein [Saprospiraceae bacterium]
APYAFLWSPGGETSSYIQLIPPFQNGTISVHISDTIGCSYQKEMMIKVKPCHLDTIVSEDDSNDTQTPDDGPIGNGKFVSPGVHRVTNATAFDYSLKVYPIPATETIQVEWAIDMDDATTLIIYDIRGQLMYQSNLSKPEIDGHRTQINVRDYVDGVYLVLLQTKQTILTSRLLKM